MAFCSLWTAALARPFYKMDELTKIRPVLCSESLTKYAFGLLVRRATPALERACGPQQFSMARSNGAALEVSQIRAAAAAYPDRVFISLDIKNAFGQARWADVLPLLLVWTLLCTTVQEFS